MVPIYMYIIRVVLRVVNYYTTAAAASPAKHPYIYIYIYNIVVCDDNNNNIFVHFEFRKILSGIDNNHDVSI